jgi:acyl-CoA dehydrogenase
MDLVQQAALWWTAYALAAIACAYLGVGRRTWTVLLGALAAGLVCFSAGPLWSEALAFGLWALPALLFGIAPLRRLLLSRPLLAFYRSSMPELSATEREALDAGGTWFDAELFSGRPDFETLLALPEASLSAAERAFLEGPTEQLCAMLDDHAITDEVGDLPPAVWAFIKQQGFLGMVIPPEFGGKGFSQHGHAAVIMKLATKSISAALDVMIPNSVGPGKLLLKYGTEAQKRHWLPRLANGSALPCFALTGLEAGSDAGAMTDVGVVCRQDGVIGIRLDFDKRYITLAPTATVLGLAFKLRDPEQLLPDAAGKGVERGITIALVPADAKGVTQGRRHKPLHMAFLNGPLSGRGVFVPLDAVIGGPELAGRGWRMLMECLTDGRAISLPALSTAAAKVALRAASAYARVRVQFRTPIARFEGIEEALARLAGNAYAMDAARSITLAALDAGHRPSVISGIVKYNLTARAGECVQDAIAIHGGAGIMLGPANPVGQLLPFPAVGMTVEGHNILTRSMIVFGQGAIRGHACLREELEAAGEADPARALARFDAAVTRHIGLVARNKTRAFLLALTGARLARAPRGVAPASVRHFRALSRMSAAFAYLTDILLLLYRGELKRRERISARMADWLSQLYLASCALKRFHEHGAPEEDRPLLDYAVEDALHRAEAAAFELLANLPVAVRWAMRVALFPLGRSHAAPSDALAHLVSARVTAPGALRERLIAGMYAPVGADRFVVLEDAFRRAHDAAPLEAKRRAKQALSVAEQEALAAADAARRAAIAVDDF